MGENPRFNTQLVQSQEEVDQLNKEFYEKFNYPWPPASFESFFDQSFGLIMLNQDVGNWKHNRLPAAPKIWVAGCGTNQAVYTALKFPHGQVLGTDISAQSLDTCHNSARQIGIENLSLEERSLHDIPYTDKFDYIICTGVIHHTADPQQALAKLATALKPDGILELMVYNYYHRFLTTAYQKAVRLLCGSGSSMNLDVELQLTKKLINTFPAQNAMAHFLANFKNAHEADLADRLLQPVEYSYTIASLGELAESCHLELLLPCLNLFDKTENRLSWNTPFEDPEIERSYVALPDTSRWEITNLLIGSDSPILWFYLQRKDSPQPRKTEQEVCKEFLDTRFEKYMTHRNIYRRDKDGGYALLPQRLSYPAPAVPKDAVLGKIYAGVRPEIPMKDVFRNQQLDCSFQTVNHARIGLTTTAFPYLKAVS